MSQSSVKRRVVGLSGCASCGGSLANRNKPHIAVYRQGCAREALKASGRANRKVRIAIASGEIAKANDCACADCGEPARVYDHRDYALPLAVDPVCSGCNIRRGPAAPFNRYIAATAR